jgi:hypothetical protein
MLHVLNKQQLPGTALVHDSMRRAPPRRHHTPHAHLVAHERTHLLDRQRCRQLPPPRV